MEEGNRTDMRIFGCISQHTRSCCTPHVAELGEVAQGIATCKKDRERWARGNIEYLKTSNLELGQHPVTAGYGRRRGRVKNEKNRKKQRQWFAKLKHVTVSRNI